MNTLADHVYVLLGDEWCGNTSVPLNHRAIRIVDKHGCERVFSILEDAFEIGIGSPDEWQTLIPRPDFHRMIFWYLLQWGLGEWFGLRRTIWYWALGKKCERYQMAGKT